MSVASPWGHALRPVIVASDALVLIHPRKRRSGHDRTIDSEGWPASSDAIGVKPVVTSLIAFG
jgi:hypothetical protein